MSGAWAGAGSGGGGGSGNDPLTLNPQSGITYTFALGDTAKYTVTSNSSAVTATIPPEVDVAWPTGSELVIQQGGTGLLTLAAGAGVTLNAVHSLVSSGQYGVLTAKKTGTNTWTVSWGRGFAVTNRAAWSGATAYYVNDLVTLTVGTKTSSYLCKLAHTNQTPPNGTYWDLVASGGGIPPVGFVFDADDVIPAPTTSPQIGVKNSGTIVGVRVYGSTKAGTAVTGSVTIDVWKAAQSDTAVPLLANSIVASAKPTITNKVFSEDTTLTGWGSGKTVSAGDQFVFRIDTISNFKWVAIILDIQ